MPQSRESVSRMGVSGTLIGVALFSGIINLLGFTGPLFMLEVYDRVIPSGSLPTLVALLILAAGLYAFSGSGRTDHYANITAFELTDTDAASPSVCGLTWCVRLKAGEMVRRQHGSN